MEKLRCSICNNLKDPIEMVVDNRRASGHGSCCKFCFNKKYNKKSPIVRSKIPLNRAEKVVPGMNIVFLPNSTPIGWIGNYYHPGPQYWKLLVSTKKDCFPKGADGIPTKNGTRSYGYMRVWPDQTEYYHPDTTTWSPVVAVKRLMAVNVNIINVPIVVRNAPQEVSTPFLGTDTSCEAWAKYKESEKFQDDIERMKINVLLEKPVLNGIEMKNV